MGAWPTMMLSTVLALDTARDAVCGAPAFGHGLRDPARLQTKLGADTFRLLSAAASRQTAVGFKRTQLALVELEPTPLDHWGKLS